MKLDLSTRSRLPGLLVAVGAVAFTTTSIYLLRQFMPVVSTGVVYLIGVMLISIYWGFALGLLTALLSSAAFNWFHIPPTGRFTIASSEDWIALVVFAVAAAVVSTVASAARQRAAEAEERRKEADLTAEMARLLLGGESLEEAFSLVGQRLAEALELSWTQIVLRKVTPGPRQTVIPLTVGVQAGSLLLPAELAGTTVLARLRERIVPALEALLRASVHRDELQAQVVETEALRRSDEVKTALLRATSHDLRSPLTTILASAEAARSPTLDEQSRGELLRAISGEAARLARLVEKLLDLSRLQAGAAVPRLDWCSIEEVLDEAVDEVSGDGVSFNLSFADGLPFLRADADQLERAFVNLFENARRYAEKEPIVVSVRRTADKLRVQIVDRGPGIAAEHIPHVFEPFYRASEGSGHTGSGLGLAIARGFVEANGGRIAVDSLPGQGTTFTVEFEIDGSRSVATAK